MQLENRKKNSDIDIIVEPPNNIGFKFAGIELELEKKLNKKVDLISYNGLSPYLKERILKFLKFFARNPILLRIG